MKRLVLQVSHKDKTGKWRNANVGSGFVRDDGSISIAIDPGVAIVGTAEAMVTLREPLPPRGQSYDSNGRDQRDVERETKTDLPF